MNAHRRLLLAGTVSVAMLVIGVGIAVAVSQRDRTPSSPGGYAVAQGATATSGGITLRLESTAFSGTSTDFKFDYTLDLSELPSGTLPATQQLLQIDPTTDVQTTGFQSGQPTATLDPAALTFRFQLPPVVPGAKPTITFKSIVLSNGGNAELVQGPWTFAVTPPTAAAEATALAVQPLQPHTVIVQGTSITVSGTRTAGAIELDYQLPPGWRELAPPVIIANDGTATLPYKAGGGQAGGESQAFFGPGAVSGSSFQVRLGPWSKPGGQAASLTLNLGAALDRVGLAPDAGAAGGKARPFSVQPGDILSSSVAGLFASADLTTETGPGCPCAEVEVTVNGDYHPADAKGSTLAQVTGTSGQPLKVADEQVSYHKTSDLNVGLGTTTITFLAPARSELDRVTINLGGGAVIVPRTDVFTMSP